ncbi:hypothetical protein AX15_006724 [Amanita polypyramis BW_CC]|nr:hypothetical protein AX15_006724 [Amanita polypyramis BW_CC]
MPLTGNTTILPSKHRKPFFKDSSELDAWASNPEDDLESVLPYVPRNHIIDPNVASRGKLLVCHDFKGGYSESPFSLSYTFNFWSLIDIFVYFSHNRITIPPPGWINAAHRHGVKMLGVLMFEHEEHVPDLVHILSGPFGDAMDTFSGHYATVLADLAHQRGFDGYLLNFEQPLPGGADQAGMLALWVRLLREELWKKVGQHAEVIWYDSVMVDGQLKYQNGLNDKNLPFFLSSTGFFANYFWKKGRPLASAEYFLSLNPNNLLTRDDRHNPLMSSETAPNNTLTMRDIYVGIDVWGRGTLGGGGFHVYKALEQIAPDSLGLSAALFGQGWTWEKWQNEPGRTWQKWWDEEVTFWAGKVPGLDMTKLLKSDEENVYKPVADFFVKRAPPDPKNLPFFTTFSPGVGKGWWVRGKNVWDRSMVNNGGWTSGWLDIEKLYSLGDLLWPVPTVVDVGHGESKMVSVQVSIDFTDAWNGGSSVRILFLESAQTEQTEGVNRSFWIPVQSLSLTPEENYTMVANYKLVDVVGGIVADVELELRSVSGKADDVHVTIVSGATHSALGGNWVGLQTTVGILPGDSDASAPVNLALGLRFNVKGRTLTKGQILLGQMNVHSPPLDSEGTDALRVCNFMSHLQDEDGTMKIRGLEDLDGILTWGEETRSHPARLSLLRRCAYWNIYVRQLVASQDDFDLEEDVKDATWIGTSGVGYSGDGKIGRFVVMGKNLATRLSLTEGDSGKLRFFVQGIPAAKEGEGWERILWTDTNFRIET